MLAAEGPAGGAMFKLLKIAPQQLAVKQRQKGLLVC
jgi:hypothetical protein